MIVYLCARVFQGEDIFRRLQSALRRGKVKVRIAQNEPSSAQPQNDSRLLHELGKGTVPRHAVVVIVVVVVVTVPCCPSLKRALARTSTRTL